MNKKEGLPGTASTPCADAQERSPKERPILFSGPMVRAILDGRKTQTRRVVKPQPNLEPSAYPGRVSVLMWRYSKHHATSDQTSWLQHCPYGALGDRLWVRESWCVADQPGGYAYMADHPGDPRGLGWRPSIHMPRAASRIVLEIIGVRVERLQDISETDARAEGAMFHDGRPTGHHGWRHDFKDVHADARSSYARLWNEINGPGSWDANPWVWVVESKRLGSAEGVAAQVEGRGPGRHK